MAEGRRQKAEGRRQKIEGEQIKEKTKKRDGCKFNYAQ